MSGDRSYASVPERITWTTGFRVATDKLVLGALSTFANFETGKGARVRVNKLAARAELPKRTVQRGLHRLEADGWIVAARRQHKGATSWDINLDRLATTWVAMKAVGGVMPSFPQGDAILNATGGAQLNATGGAQAPLLNATGGAQGSILNAASGAQLTVLERHGWRADPLYKDQIPSTTIGSPVEPIPSAPALRAGFADDADEKHEDVHAAQPATPDPDLRADRRADSDPADGGARRRGGDHPAAPTAGLPLRQGPDSPGTEGDRRPRAPVEPQQQTFGPIDVSPPPARQPQWGQLADALREGLKRKSG